MEPRDPSFEGVEGDVRRIDERHQSALHRIDERHSASWSAHKEIHAQEQEAIRVALQNMEKRLDGMNEWRGTIGDRDARLATRESVTSLEARFTRFEEDTRRRFEEMGVELRREVRPGQDMKTSQAAIIAAVVLVIMFIGFLITIANFVGPGS